MEEINNEVPCIDVTTIALNDKEGRLVMRSSIEEYEAAMKEEAGDDRGIADEINAEGLTQYLIGGAYTRILDIPAGTTIVSK